MLIAMSKGAHHEAYFTLATPRMKQSKCGVPLDPTNEFPKAREFLPRRTSQSESNANKRVYVFTMFWRDFKAEEESDSSLRLSGHLLHLLLYYSSNAQ